MFVKKKIKEKSRKLKIVFSLNKSPHIAHMAQVDPYLLTYFSFHETLTATSPLPFQPSSGTKLPGLHHFGGGNGQQRGPAHKENDYRW
jgi:hypothetical protein